MSRSRKLGVSPAIAALLAALLLAVPASAEPDSSRVDELEDEVEQLEEAVREGEAELEDLDDQADELRDEETEARERLQEIEAELSLAVERYNEAVVELESIQAEREATADELEQVSAQVEALGETVEDYARRLHKLGPSVEMTTILGGGDPVDLGFKTTSLRLILSGEQADLDVLAATQDRVDALERRLAEQEAEADHAAALVEDELVLVQETHDEHEDELAELTTYLDDVVSEGDAQRTQLESDRDDLQQARAQLADERDAYEDAVAAYEAEQEAEQQAEQEAEQEAEQQAGGDGGGSSNGSSDGSSGGGSSGGSASGGSSGDSSSGSTSAPRQSAQVAVDTALAQVGKPYQWGATGPNAFDCSGLTSYAWAAAGVSIPRTSGAQFSGLTRVSRSDLQPGDLVFYNSPISHVAMYVGGDTIVEASRSGIPVRTATLSNRTPVGYARP